MAVHLTKIYTRTGDDGTTMLGDGSRVSKIDSRISAYADVDETNAALGVAIALGSLGEDINRVVRIVQNDLFDVGADLCAPIDIAQGGQDARLRISDNYITRLERWCDQFNADLPKLNSFILSGGTAGAALLHQARTVARRAERSTWALLAVEPNQTNPLTAQYLNRVSDLLFILARSANPDGDVLWQPGRDG